MIYKIRISSEATQDIEQALSYYSNFSTSAAKSYLVLFETNEEEKMFLFMQFLMRIEILQNIQNKK